MKNLNYKEVEFLHATLKKPVRVLLGSIASYQHSDKANAVCIFTIAGIIPVNETMDEVSKIIKEAGASEENT
jgi:hypothetical protein